MGKAKAKGDRQSWRTRTSLRFLFSRFNVLRVVPCFDKFGASTACRLALSYRNFPFGHADGEVLFFSSLS